MKKGNLKKVLFFGFLSFLFAMNLNAQKQKALESITIDEIKNHMHFLASDYLKGRVASQDGYKIAAEYCAAQFKSIGLIPAFKDEKGAPTYFQNVPLIKKTFSKECGISLKTKDGIIKLEHGKDFKLPDRIRDFSTSEINIAFVGYGIHEPKHGWDDFKKMDLKGKVVITLMGTPSKKGNPVLPADVDKSYQSIPGFQKKFMKIMEQNPAVVIIIPDDKLLKQVPWEVIPSHVGGSQIYYDKPKTEGAYGTPIIYAVTQEAAENFFKDQKFSPISIKKNGLKGYKSFDLKDIKLVSNFKIESEEKIVTRNIAGVVKGTDEALINQHVTVGAHLDHVVGPGGKINNGADDNASGSTGVLEVAEAMVNTPSKRSTMFILFAAEELGLVGSNHFVNNPPVSIEDIVFNINLDMIGRSAGEHKKSRSHGVIIHKEFFTGVSKFVKDVNDKTIKWPLHFSDGSKMGGDSDHSSFNNKGIPHAFFFSGLHEDLHRPTDDVEKIDFEKMQKISQLTYLLTKELGDKDVLNFK